MLKRHQKTIDELAKVLKDVHPARLSQLLDKRERVNLRVSETDKQTMKALSKSLNLTVTEYLTRLHAFVYDKLKDRLKER
jgi:hypothetical protein